MPQCHYETLGVPKNASTEAIKAAYRKLALEHHPDVAGKNTKEAFARISDAASVLTNPSKRRKYDRRLDSSPFQSGFRHNENRGGRAGGPRSSGWSYTTHIRPRNLLLAPFFFFGAVAGIQYALGIDKKSKKSPEPLVQAWKNPSTGQWEQPAPWDPVYKDTKPELHMIPRSNVISRKM